LHGEMDGTKELEASRVHSRQSSINKMGITEIKIRGM